MITKIISGLLGVSIVLSSNLADARTIWLPGKTNGGSRLAIETSPQPTYNPSTGLTYFSYSIQNGRRYKTHQASTWYCYKGIVQKNPNFRYTNGIESKNPEWSVDSLEVGGEAPIVTADSEASLNLLKAICAVVYP